MSGQVVGVHGIWNRRPGKTLAEATEIISAPWTAALRAGLGGGSIASVTVAYYAEHLAKEVAQGSDDPEYMTEAEQRMLLEWAAELGAPAEVAQGRFSQPARAATSWIACRFGLDGAMVRSLVIGFCREVHAYLHEPDRRTAVRHTVAAVIAEQDPAIVIAHSLGSVVAYETLWAYPDLQVDLLVTLGSPLALPGVIFPHLDPAAVNGKGTRPDGVRKWINIADPGDIVAIPRGLPTWFDGIDADIVTPAGVFNGHKATAYLRCAAVAGAVAAVLGTTAR